jgi:hypothetical protein
MLPDGKHKKVIDEMTRLVHADRWRDAALCVLDFAKLDVKVESDDPKACLPPIQWMFHWMLNNDALEEAAQLLWTRQLFDPRPQCSKDVWKLFDESNFGLIMGASSMSKSYTMGVRLFMEWLRDPEWTTVKCIGPSADHLEQNLFSHIVALHRQSKLPLPGEIGELYIGLDRRNYVSSITGVIIPVGQTKKAGRLQGGKRKPRTVPHPVFGPLSRMFIFLDEIENVPKGIWFDLDNVMSNLDVEESEGLKIFGAYNPTNPNDEVGKRAEPKFGWPDFNPDKHYRWKSTRGWEVLRLDGERCENVVKGEIVFPGLQSKAGLEQLARNSGGKQSAGYSTFGRGAYPEQGAELTIFPPGMVAKARGEFIWLNTPVACGACDLALEGGAAALFSLGKWGLATGVKYPPSAEYPDGRVVMFKDKSGRVKPRHGLLLEQQFPLLKGETVAMKNAVIKTCRSAGIAGNLFCVDRTGHGQGIYDLIRFEWSNEVIGVNYSEGSTNLKVMQEDEKKAEELYDRVCSELWFAMRAWTDFGFFMIHPQVNMENLAPQLTNRKFRMSGGKNKAESKKDYKSRGFSSPDEADSATLLVHAIRVGTKTVPSMVSLTSTVDDTETDEWYDGGRNVRIDPSNMADRLNESESDII